MNKIIFLDIDGPIIPIDVPVMESVFRTTYNKESIINLNLICEETGAKIVTNSMHNYEDWMDGDLRDDLVLWGVNEDFFHDNWRTIFPMIDYRQVMSPVRGVGRMVAIEEWINYHGKTHWVCFDDRKFSDVANLIHIQDGKGITTDHALLAVDILNMC